MSTHDDAKDPKDLDSSHVMKPDPKFQNFFDTLVNLGSRKGACLAFGLAWPNDEGLS